MSKYLPPAYSVASGPFLDNLGVLLDVARHPGESDQDYRQRMIDEQQHQLAIAAKRRDDLLLEAIKKAAPCRMRMEDFTLSAEEMERLQAPLRRCVITPVRWEELNADEAVKPYTVAAASTPVRWKELSADEICKEVREDVAELRAKDLGIDADWLWSQPLPATVTPPFMGLLRQALRQLDVARSMFFELQHANYYADPAVRQYCADMVKSIDDAKNKMLYGGKHDGE